jgi:hypothetical protein
MNRSLRWAVVLGGGLLLALGVGAVLLATTLPVDWRERLTGKTPQAEISVYLKAILRRDRQAALEVWEVQAPDPDRSARLEERREQVTDELLALKMSEFAVFQPQWWTTCCEPQVTCTSRAAGGARIQVQILDGTGMPWIYTFDVFSREQPYWGDAMGNPSRDWVLRDLYAQDQEPLFWRLVYESNVMWLDSESTAGEPAD